VPIVSFGRCNCAGFYSFVHCLLLYYRYSIEASLDALLTKQLMSKRIFIGQKIRVVMETQYCTYNLQDLLYMCCTLFFSTCKFNPEKRKLHVKLEGILWKAEIW
jgi:hypothetical protein